MTLIGSVTGVSAQTVKTSSAQTTPKAAAAVVSTASESDADKAGKAQLVERLMTEKSYLYSQIIDKCFTFKLSPTCWATFSDPANDTKSAGFDAAGYLAGSAILFAKKEGLGDLTLLNVSGGQEKGNRPQMDEIVAKLRQKFSMTVEAPINCTKKASDLITRYPYEVMKVVGEDTWSPKSGEAHFTVVLSPAAKDMSVKISPDGKRFTVSGPALVEAYSTPNKIAAGMAPANKNR